MAKRKRLKRHPDQDKYKGTECGARFIHSCGFYCNDWEVMLEHMEKCAKEKVEEDQ